MGYDFVIRRPFPTKWRVVNCFVLKATEPIYVALGGHYGRQIVIVALASTNGLHKQYLKPIIYINGNEIFAS